MLEALKFTIVSLLAFVTVETIHQIWALLTEGPELIRARRLRDREGASDGE
jgi:hypothetical protein